MFKKQGNSKGGDPLANRLQAIASKPALDSNDYTDVNQAGARARPKRVTTFKQATLQLGSGERVAVVIKNVGSTGARIDFFKHVTLPRQAKLVEPSMNLNHWVDVIWQRNGSAGVRFCGR